MKWELHATDGTNQTSLVNVSVFHHGIINNNYYKVPHVFFSFSLSLRPRHHTARLSVFTDLVLLMVSLDFVL